MIRWPQHDGWFWRRMYGLSAPHERLLDAVRETSEHIVQDGGALLAYWRAKAPVTQCVDPGERDHTPDEHAEHAAAKASWLVRDGHLSALGAVALTVGAWYVAKYRTAAAERGRYPVALQLRKQGVPLDIARKILLDA